MAKNSMMLTLVMILVMMAFFVYYDKPNMDMAEEYIVLMPSLILVTISIYGIKNSRGSAPIVGSFIMLGVGFALLSDVLNTLGVIIPDLLTATFTLPYLQALLIFFSTIIGVSVTQG